MDGCMISSSTIPDSLDNSKSNFTTLEYVEAESGVGMWRVEQSVTRVPLFLAINLSFTVSYIRKQKWLTSYGWRCISTVIGTGRFWKLLWWDKKRCSRCWKGFQVKFVAKFSGKFWLNTCCNKMLSFWWSKFKDRQTSEHAFQHVLEMVVEPTK